ncbi:FtsX-like permease family protein [Nibribacter ruber]|uniref:FtsX-like permease family protein n=1 Tax=Nibribacter ruber TaxID=2698458 RepID=A0A6P1P1V6_9BACT|nr:FtsX-like permease family protein [Nibribacter ruber]QHL87892.1 FtsX-like permease family protein [Nibribacter ruber]
MIRHLFKLIWNRKKSNFLLISEIFFSFLVLFGVISFGLYNYHNYQKPLGFAYDNVWLLSLETRSDSAAQNAQTQEQIMQRVRSFPEVEHAAFSSSNAPFSFSSMNNRLAYGNVKDYDANQYDVEDEYKDVMGLKVVQGRWFGPQDGTSLRQPIVINRKLQQDLFHDVDPIGKVIPMNDSVQYQVIGVTDYFRASSEYSAEDGAFFTRIDRQKNNEWRWNSLLIKVKPGTGVEFEEKMMRELGQIAKGWTMDVSTLEKMRQNKANFTLVPLIALAVVCGFLVFNVALGLFGVLWYNINKRTGEIGLRRAMGATTRQIRTQFVGEVIVLAFFGVVLGLLLAVQFPLLDVFQVSSEIYWQGIVLAGLFIFLLTALCALYPSRQASGIQPAVALHEE